MKFDKIVESILDELNEAYGSWLSRRGGVQPVYGKKPPFEGEVIGHMIGDEGIQYTPRYLKYMEAKRKGQQQDAERKASGHGPIVRSKFNPDKYVQKQGDKWVEVEKPQ